MNKELFESKPIPAAYMKLAMPVVLSGVLTLVYNMVDMFFIARTGDTNLVAGVSLCAPVFTLLVAMGDILGLGGASVMSRLLGSNDEREAADISTFCLYGAIIIGIVIAVLLNLFKTPVLYLLGANEETIDFAKSYYSWISLGAPFVILSLAPSNLLRTEGHANAAMAGSVLGSIVNMIMDPIFIFGLNMGAGGAAIATVIGNICADMVYVIFIIKKAKILSFSLKGFHITASQIGSVLAIGIPGSVTNLMQTIGVILLNNALLPYGNDKIAVFGIVSKITIIVIMIMVGVAFGGQPLFGYLYGAEMKERMNKCMKFAYKLMIGVSVVLSVVLAIAAPLMIRIFMNDESVIQAGVPMLRVVLCGMPFIGITMVSTCIFQSTGKAFNALILSTARQGYIYAAVLFLFSRLLGYTGVIAAQPTADVITACIALWLMKRFSQEIQIN